MVSSEEDEEYDFGNDGCSSEDDELDDEEVTEILDCSKVKIKRKTRVSNRTTKMNVRNAVNFQVAPKSDVRPQHLTLPKLRKEFVDENTHTPYHTKGPALSFPEVTFYDDEAPPQQDIYNLRDKAYRSDLNMVSLKSLEQKAESIKRRVNLQQLDRILTSKRKLKSKLLRNKYVRSEYISCDDDRYNSDDDVSITKDEYNNIKPQT
jgi:hypothetical protein